MVGEVNFYDYELVSSTELRGSITNNGGSTVLDVQGVEFFQFANQPGETFAFEELFV